MGEDHGSDRDRWKLELRHERAGVAVMKLSMVTNSPAETPISRKQSAKRKYIHTASWMMSGGKWQLQYESGVIWRSYDPGGHAAISPNVTDPFPIHTL
jgi:hypothetical protein